MEIKPLYKGRLLTAEGRGLETLTKLLNLLRRERIRNAARKAFFQGLRGETISFFLNKQVAFVGHVSFSEEEAESPLGPVKVRIECEDPKGLINWLAPRST
jgi:predicted RNA binding protein with dsRBD fold (UPF0201 family)